jgi:hypothetical protein
MAGDGAWMGSMGPWMGSAGLSTGFFVFFCFFDLINRGGHLNRLGKDLIYLDI